MRINKIRIHNFRSIVDIEMDCQELVVMLGPNNCGKSNILSALEYALSTSSKPKVEEFCHFRGDDNTLWVELTFHELTEQEQNTWKKYILSDGSFRFRKTARLTETAEVEISYNGYLDEPDELWLKTSSIKALSKRSEAEKTPIYELLPSSGKLKQDDIAAAQSQYINANRDSLSFNEILEEGPLLGQKNVAGGVLPDFYLIPAVRDLSDESKVKTTTIFGKLLNRAVKEMAEKDAKFIELRDGLEDLVKTLNRQVGDSKERPSQLQELEETIRRELSHWGVDVEVEVVPPVVEKIFELGTNLHLDDGVKTLAENKGHGLQRAVIFALIKAWAMVLQSSRKEDGEKKKARASSDSIIFAIEEPELYLHPHAQKRMANAIYQISESPNHQIFLSSHSSHFVDLDKYKNICLVEKTSPAVGTGVKQCTVDLFEGDSIDDRKKRFRMAKWVNPDRGEMFFAKRVVFVEGETEKVVLPYLAQKLGNFSEDISIIDCGSKHNLPLYINIANAFQMPYVVIHDEDPLPDPIPQGWDSDKIKGKRTTFRLNAEIEGLVESSIGKVEMFSSDFEEVAGVSRSQGERKGKPLAALDHFDEVESEDIPARICEVVNSIYTNE